MTDSRSRIGDTVLFLDIDGPLRPHGVMPGQEPWAGRYDGVCPRRLALLNRLSSVERLRIVVSSTWRSDPTTPGALLEQGLAIPFHRSWRTTLDVPGPDTPMRGWQVERWLEANPSTERYAILDDQDDFTRPMLDRLVRTDPFEGLTESHVTALKALLDVPPDPGRALSP